MSAIQRSEDELRDHLACHLHIVEANLTLVDTEYVVRNEKGAGGFIDILARDERNDLVIIELKRSNQSARQALHELEKYVRLLAADRGVRLDRLRCILVSTVWHELLVPFAGFARHADFYVVGRILRLGEDGFAAGSELVNLPSLSAGLETCPLHLHLLFSSKNARNAASRPVSETLSSLFIEDYITVNLDYIGTSSRIIYPFSHYVVFANFAEPLREFIRLQFPADCEEEPEDSPWWHEQLVQGSIVEAVRANEVAVGSPDSFGALAGWQVSGVTGFGRYADRKVWSNTALLETVQAAGERFSMPFQRQVAVANKPAWTRMRNDLNLVLPGCGSWPEIVSKLLDEVERCPEAEVKIHAYAPNNILFGLDHLGRTGGNDYLPQLIVAVNHPTTKIMVGGILRWDGNTLVTRATQTMGVVFGDFLSYVAAQVTGSLWEVETELCALHGLSYDIVEWDITQDFKQPRRLTLAGGGELLRTPVDEDAPTPRAFFEAHRDYLGDLITVFDTNSYGRRPEQQR